MDLVIRGAQLVDGTGEAARSADIGIVDGKIVEIGDAGSIGAVAGKTVDADGQVLMPGAIDPHTHYDAQILWDPIASPSTEHGVTTIIGGNCGFTVAPIKARDAGYIREMLAKVEGMPLKALEDGVDWNWETFDQYLDRLEGGLGVNAGFLVGHCAIRRYVMGEESVGNAASPEQIADMVELLKAGMSAGGLGFSTTLSKTHSDGDGQPVPSRWATNEEVLALSAAVGEFEGTFLEGIVDGCLDRFSDDEIELFANMSAVAGRPLNWNVLTVDSRETDRVDRQLECSLRARELGGRVVALTMPVQVPMNMSFGSFCALNLIPGWGDILGLPVAERIQKLQDPAVREMMQRQATSNEAGVLRRLADWSNYVIGDVYSDANRELKGKIVKDIAAQRGTSAFDTLIEIVIADNLQTILWPIPIDGDDASWKLRQDTWAREDIMLGGSDAGAHLDRMCGAPYPTRFIGDCINGRQLVSMERAVEMMTSVPADLFGLFDRGRIAVGNRADMVLFDPTTIGASHATMVNDLPGGTARLVAAAKGVHAVWVNGTRVFNEGKPTGHTPGTVLRSGRDTKTVSTR